MSDDKKTYWFHSKPVQATSKRGRRKRFTIAAVIEPNGTGSNLHFGIAVCSFNDNFSRKVGREISTSRAIESPVYTMHITKEQETKIGPAFHQGVEAIRQLMHL